MSDPFPIQRGLFQGDCLSPLLFLICIQPFAQYIRLDNQIKGITYRNSTKKISLIADDVLIIVQSNEANFTCLDNVINKFSSISGLTINREKTVITSIGKKGNPLTSALNYTWSNGQFRYLGFRLSQDDRNIASLNIDPMVMTLSDYLKKFKRTSISLWGRVLIVKFLVASKFVYPSTFLPMPDNVTFQILKDEIINYIWMGGRHKMS